MVLFKIGNTDYTAHIVQGNYDVKQEPVYKEWTDANLVNHRLEIRKRIKGSFSMVFKNIEEATAFNSAVKNNETDGYVNVSLRCNDTNELINARCSLEYSFIRDKRGYIEDYYTVFKVKVTER